MSFLSSTIVDVSGDHFTEMEHDWFEIEHGNVKLIKLSWANIIWLVTPYANINMLIIVIIPE